MQDYTTVLGVEPGNTDALFQRGTAHEKRGAIDTAVADFTAVIGLDGMHAKALYARGACYNLKGDFAKAVGKPAGQSQQEGHRLLGSTKVKGGYTVVRHKLKSIRMISKIVIHDACRGLCACFGKGQHTEDRPQEAKGTLACPQSRE